MPSSPLSTRKLDILYLIFFLTHIPIILFVDASSLYPPSLTPAISITIRDFYISTYRDRFFIAPPAWFKAYIWMEVLYHLPVSLWIIKALVQDNPLLPLNLFIFAIQTAVTTLTCLVEMLSWEGYTSTEIGRLCGIYVPYLFLSIFMGADAFLRVRKTLLAASTGKSKEV